MSTALLVATAVVPLTASSAAAATPICLSGKLSYDYESAEAGRGKPTLTKPVRNANIQLWGKEKATDAPRPLTADYRYTAVADGGFNLCYTPTATPMSSIWVRFSTESTKLWKVSDGNGAVYTFDSPTRSDLAASADLGTLKASSARAWHAFDTVNLLWWARNNPVSDCWSTHEANNDACTELNIRWTANSADGPVYDLANTVYLPAAAPDSEHTVLHEAGHFFQHRLYNGQFPAVSGCSPHYVDKVSSASCAWTEGFADSVAAYLLKDSRYVWPDGGSQSFTYTTGWQTGDQVQGNVDGALLELWNNVDGGWDRTISVMTARKPATFADYFKTGRPTANPALSTTGSALTALAAHAINYGPTPVGDGRTHVLTNGGGLAVERSDQCGASASSPAVLATADPTRNKQQWTLRAEANGTAKLIDGCPDHLVLTAPTTSGGQTTLRAVNSSSPYQEWKVTQNNSGTYTITNPATGYTLDSAADTPGAAVTANPTGTANSQNWAALT
ncbi:ricin-type beta-trefoil lectin domain protein [Kitasatospora sp. NBC_00070]|uniref:RICIN domain-containing protein n=1 Tax=Kitasatospora sp. NBC_00070 TaxID=2975962 RepID=UPI003243119C